MRRSEPQADTHPDCLTDPDANRLTNDAAEPDTDRLSDHPGEPDATRRPGTKPVHATLPVTG